MVSLAGIEVWFLRDLMISGFVNLIKFCQKRFLLRRKWSATRLYWEQISLGSRQENMIQYKLSVYYHKLFWNLICRCVQFSDLVWMPPKFYIMYKNTLQFRSFREKWKVYFFYIKQHPKTKIHLISKFSLDIFWNS